MTALTQDVVLSHDAHDATDGRADQNSGAGGIDSLDAGVRPGFARRSDGENDVALESASVLRPTIDSGSKSLTSEAMRTGKSLASNARIQSTPLARPQPRPRWTARPARAE